MYFERERYFSLNSRKIRMYLELKSYVSGTEVLYDYKQLSLHCFIMNFKTVFALWVITLTTNLK